LGRLGALRPVRPRVDEVPVDRVDDEALAAVGLGARHVRYTSPTWLRSPSMRLNARGLVSPRETRAFRPRRVDSIRAPPSVTDEPSRMIECSISLPRIVTPSPTA